jgi:hypothetical protein
MLDYGYIQEWNSDVHSFGNRNRKYILSHNT